MAYIGAGSEFYLHWVQFIPLLGPQKDVPESNYYLIGSNLFLYSVQSLPFYVNNSVTALGP